MRHIGLMLVLLIPFAPFADAQSNDQFEPVLLPISLLEPIPGAFGSVWATDFWITAVGGVVSFENTEQCGACPVRIYVPRDSSLHNAGANNVAIGEAPGEIIWLDRGSATNARFSLRVFDTSRESKTWGTEVPVVRESQYHANTITLVNVPLDSRFRVTLRAYDPDVHQNASFRFDFRDLQSGATLASRVVTAIYKPSGRFGFPRVATYAQIGDLAAAVPELTGVEAVRVDVSPLDEVTRFWAFASVTNNETQHVTLVTPQQEP